MLAGERFYSSVFYPECYSLWFVLEFLCKFISGVLYISFVFLFMLFELVNLP
jgi:hypothetical protein